MHVAVMIIHVDNRPYRVDKFSMIGAEILGLAGYSASDYKLFLETPGPADDELIRPDQVVELRDGMHFQTVQSRINPGSDR